MHQIPPFIPSIKLISRYGRVHVFSSMIAALKALSLRWIELNVALHFDEFVRYEYLRSDRDWCLPPIAIHDKRDFIMRNECDDILTVDDFKKVALQLYLASRRCSPYPETATGPVPGTGRYRHGRSYRSPRTMQARRQAALVLREDGEVATRVARTGRYLPSTWDDLFRKSSRVQNWKRFRRHQWKN